jgi:prepilin-type N-terminal cleavage/methylation domain-containing protein
MKLLKQAREQDPRGRSGFTLIEMLVVMAIIAVLVSLTAGGVFQIVEGQKQSNTEQTIRVLSKALKQQWEVVVTQAKNENPPPSVVTMAGGDARRAKVIWIKLRLKQEFPMNFQEALSPWKNNLGSADVIPSADLPSLYTTVPSVANPGDQSSVCLLLALRARSGAAFNVDNLGAGVVADSLNAAYVNPTNNSVLQVAQDAWGTPLAFNRWPTPATAGKAFWQELDSLNPAGASTSGATFRDPLDPEGLLLTPSWYNDMTLRPAFEQICHVISNNGTQSSYIVPVISSAGRDNQYYTDDDSYSFRLRYGAKGD